jgi:predicted pyridoxine 5'-phosphate oxidase superfamily flavin-nucleotide-binding protein
MVGVYHSGELAAQARAGLRAEADRVGGIVRTDIPPAAAVFLTEQRMLVIGGADERGRMWSSLLTGEPGFLRTGMIGGEPAIDIAARPPAGDPLADALTRRTRIGAIALDPATRRRMRINGIAEPTERGLLVRAEQVYANCPKYIQRRELVSARGDRTPTATVTTELTEADRRMVTDADTFFIVTTSADGHRDASHRGGNPGFVRLEADGELAWPDFPGNAMMMTLGNLEQSPLAGLLFLDWSTGTTLQLTGAARTDWTGPARWSRFHVAEVRRTELASPLSWTEPEYSRFNPPNDASLLAS